MCSSPETASAIDRLFVRGLGEAEFRDLRAHLASCEECRERYDRLSRVKLALSKEPGLPSDQLTLLGAGLIDGGSRPARRRSPLALGAAIVAGAAAAGVAAAVLLAVRPDHGQFQARGAAGHAAEGVRAYCIQPGSPPRVLAEAISGGALSCPQGASVQFSYTAGSATHLAIVGVEPSGAVVPFFPQEAGAGPIESRRIDVPLPYSTPLREARPGETIRVVAIHADRALSREAIEAVARGGRSPGIVRVEELALRVEP